MAAPEPDALARLRALCRPGAELRVVFGHGDGDVVGVRELPDLADDGHLDALRRRYADAGFAVTARRVSREEVGRLDTTWAKKLAFSAKPRRFVELHGHASDSAIAGG